MVVVGCENSRQDRGVVVVGRAGVWWYHLCGEVWNSRAVLVHFTILYLLDFNFLFMIEWGFFGRFYRF